MASKDKPTTTIAPASMDVEVEKKAWIAWRASRHADGDKRAYISFDEWLLERGATKLEHERIESP
jgi:hypothetical protein